jgi:uncharacterized membrane protein YdjX (TVP38/TMEM64 family)
MVFEQGGEHPGSGCRETPRLTASGNGNRVFRSVRQRESSREMSENEQSSPSAGPVGNPVRRWAPLGILLAAIAAAYLAGLQDYLSLEAIAENRDALIGFVTGNLVAALAIYAVVYAVSVALSLPGAAFLTILGGFLFGWFGGGLLTVFAATAGATLVFLVARTSLGEALASRAGPWMSRLSKGFREDAFHYLLFLRLVPVFPFWLVNIAPALAGVGLGTYVLTTFVGIIPGTFAFSFVGSGLDSVIMAQKQKYQACLDANPARDCEFMLDPGALITPEILAAMAALGIVALIPVIWKKLRRRGRPAGAADA